MLVSLFSVFDPSAYSSSWYTWGMCFFLFFFFPVGKFVTMGRTSFFILKITEEFFFLKFGKGVENMFSVCLFFLILVVNFLGLLPGVFSVSSQVIFSLSFSLPIWLASLFIGFKGVYGFMSRFVPAGAPLGLSWFLVFVEVFGNFVRPMALFIRLSVNMTVGHILLVLLGGLYIEFFSFLGGSMIFILEILVCFVQSYVFVKLLQLYCEESYSGH